MSAVVGMAVIAGCSGGGSSALAPKPASPFGRAQFLTYFGPSHDQIAGYYSCPAKGHIKYVSDYDGGAIYIYVGQFAGQSPCGKFTAGLKGPAGMHVDVKTHDLYVADTNQFKIVVFHRGQTMPYNMYTDPTGQQEVVDVTLAKDGTVIASNEHAYFGSEAGSISTWIKGPNGGTFVGNFPMTNDYVGEFIALRKDGTLYYNDFDVTSGHGALWSLSCPLGACGVQTQIAGVSFKDPGGMTFDSTDDLLESDTSGVGETFELPNPRPKTFRLLGQPYGMAMSAADHHWYTGDWRANVATEYAYPSGKVIGTVRGPGGALRGVAIDP